MLTPRPNLPDPEDTIVALASAAGPGLRHRSAQRAVRGRGGSDDLPWLYA